MKYTLYNDTLNPVLWDESDGSYKLKPNVRETLQTIAEDFVEIFLKEKEIEIDIFDILLVGSSANYNYTPFSDIDLHIVTDFSKLDMSKEVAKSLFTELKLNWNNSHNIKVKGFDVELYVQDKEDDLESEAIYSVVDDKWISEPQKENPKFDKKKIAQKYTEFKTTIEDLLKKGGKESEKGLRSVLDKLYKFRQAGLEKTGEFSMENIVFKILRAKGYLDKIKDYSKELYDREVSLKEHTIAIDDGLDVDKEEKLIHSHDDDARFVKTDDENEKRIFKFQGMKVFGAYRVDPLMVKSANDDPFYGDSGEFPDAKSELAALRHAVKHPKGEESGKIMTELIDLSIERLFKQMDMSKVTVLVPLGSNSNLNKIIAKKIQSNLPNRSLIILEDVLKKNTWKDVSLSPLWHHEVNDIHKGKMRPWHASAKNTLDRKRREEPDLEFQVKKVPQSYRKYYSSFYSISPERRVDLLKVIPNSVVLLIDDTLEEGATIRDALREVNTLNPSLVMAYIFLFGRGT